MLRALRKHMKLVFWAIIILIVPAFVLWFAPRGYYAIKHGNLTFGMVFGSRVRENRFISQLRAEERDLRFFRNVVLTMKYKENDEWGLKRQALLGEASLQEFLFRKGYILIPVAGRLLPLTGTDRNVLTAMLSFTDEQIEKFIEMQFYDRDEDEFNQEEYSKFLNKYGMTADEYKDEVRGNLRVAQYIAILLSSTGLQEDLTWGRIILLKEAARWGIVVTDNEVGDYLGLRFGDENGFNQKLYSRYLQTYGITTSDYENEVRENMKIEKLMSLIQQTAKVTPQEIREKFDYENAKKKLKYHKQPIEELIPLVDVADEEVEDFYQTNLARIEKFKIPRQVRVQYIMVETSSFYDQIEITEEEMRKFYDDNTDLFTEKTGGESENRTKPFEEVKDEIVKRLRQLKRPESEKLAKEKATRIFTITNAALMKQVAKRSGLPLRQSGLIGKEGPIDNYIGSNDEKFRKAALTTPLGEVSDIIETNIGYCILSPTEIIPDAQPRIAKFEDIKEIAIEEYKKNQASEMAFEIASALHKKVLAKMEEEEVDFDTACKSFELDVEETDFFRRIDESIKDFEDSRFLIQYVFMLEDFGSPPEYDIFSLEDDVIFFEISETKLAAEEEYEEQKERYRKELLADKQVRVYREWVAATVKKADLKVYLTLEKLAEMRSKQAQKKGKR